MLENERICSLFTRTIWGDLLIHVNFSVEIIELNKSFVQHCNQTRQSNRLLLVLNSSVMKQFSNNGLRVIQFTLKLNIMFQERNLWNNHRDEFSRLFHNEHFWQFLAALKKFILQNYKTLFFYIISLMGWQMY